LPACLHFCIGSILFLYDHDPLTNFSYHWLYGINIDIVSSDRVWTLKINGELYVIILKLSTDSDCENNTCYSHWNLYEKGPFLNHKKIYIFKKHWSRISINLKICEMSMIYLPGKHQ
jgi:hypothetical protein